jgi:putative transposase
VSRCDIRSDNGPEFVVKAVQEWIAVAGAKTAYIERGSPWENGYIESFNARLRDELLNGEIFYTLREAQIVIESWRRHYNHASQTHLSERKSPRTGLLQEMRDSPVVRHILGRGLL